MRPSRNWRINSILLMPRTNQYKPIHLLFRSSELSTASPEEDLYHWVRRYWGFGLSDKKIVEHTLEHFDKEKYGFRVRAKLGLLGTRKRNASFEEITPFLLEIRERFPTMGARQMVTVLRLDYELKVPEQRLLELFRATEPEAVNARKSLKFRRKRFWAAGVMDIWAIDQHDKWQRFGLWMHCSIDPYPGRVAWLKIWWCNRNTRLINSYYIEAGRSVGGIPLITQSDRGRENNGVANMHTSLRHRLDPGLSDTLQHRWCIDKKNIKPEALWSQLRRQFTPGFEKRLDEGLNNGWYDPNDPIEKHAELDAWTLRYNSTSRRADKHKILPQGIPDLIHEKPDRSGSKNFMVIVSPELFDEIEKEWAPSNDPVFRLVPSTFNEQASVLYAAIQYPTVSSFTFWPVYLDMLAAFRALPHDPILAAALLTADQGEENDMPLMAGLRELRHGDNVVGPHGYIYHGGLEDPGPPPGAGVDGDDEGSEINSDNGGTQDDDDDELAVDLRDSTTGHVTFFLAYTAQYAADFTGVDNSASAYCGREHCATKTFPGGTKMNFLHSNNPREPGRMVCNECYQYYMQKATTKRRTSSALPTEIHQKEIRKQVSSAQRGRKFFPILKIFSSSWSAEGTNIVQAVGTSAYAAPFQAGYIIGTSNGPMRVGGPLIQLPGLTPPPAMGQIPIARPAQAGPSGYTSNHAVYYATRHSLAQKAYAMNGGNVIAVEVRVVHKPMLKYKFQLIGDVHEVVKNISVHIGAVELKQILFDEILPLWLEYTRGFQISIDDFVMRDHDGAKLRAGDPDRDIISKKFFKTVKGAQVFKEGREVINFHVPNDIYHRYLAWSEAREEEQMLRDQTEKLSIQEKKVTKPTRGGKKRQHSPEPSHDTLILTPVRASKRPKSGPCYDLSPTAHRLGDALRSQRLPSNKEIQSLFERKAIHVAIYLVEHRTLSELLDLCETSRNTFANYKAYLGAPGEAMLHLELSSKKQKKGGFKLSSFGESSRPLFNGLSKNICAKQTYYEKSGSVESMGQEIQVTQNIPHDGRTQARNLTMEIACLVWARVLLDLVYVFIEKYVTTKGQPPFTIPQLRFVEAALAVEHADSSQESRVFLVEEVIGGASEGMFRKYMNNVSPVPLPLSDEADKERALFLAFSQHVQYFKTKKMAFISDYQGGSSLLSDPQIVTNSALGVIFADGNVPSSHENFEINHRCNHFCEFFEVPSDYDLWESHASTLRPDVAA
ncbi:hypothetical protein D9615_006831 [Tricholomella constricta]|uniref:Alpha-type protein kinase domain-containing protein n=1 Tax=Tricholomella constricta TaxID=117010 RepID=A0A8H5M249_9AGAR|nr:hypothetical protein D9615_006831 [Tricholomella constricta]